MLKPLNDNIVLELEPVQKTTASGIILPEDTKERPTVAKVVAIGNGAYLDGKRIPLTVEVGQKVVFKKYATTEIKFEEKEYLIISEKDILAVVEEEK
jgi:chaperonin GroES